MEKLIDSLAIARRRAEVITNNSRVVIDENHLRALAAKLARVSTLSPPNPIASSELSLAKQIGLSILFSVVNYCFVDPETGRDYEYTSMGVTHHRSTGFINAMVSGILPWDDMGALAALSPQAWRILLHLDEPGVVLYDAEERIKRLMAMARYLHDKHVNADSFFNDYPTAESVADLLRGSGFFEDIYLKRMQVELLWLYQIAQCAKVAFALPLDQMTIMPDYRIPQVLIQEGVLLLTPDDYKKMDTELTDDSLVLALRSAVVVAGARIANVLHTSDVVIDQKLWHLSQEYIANGKMTTPAMRVRTREY